MTEAKSFSTPSGNQSSLPQPSEPGLPVVGSDSAGTQRLVELLQKQRDRYQKLQALSRTQSQLVESAATEPLLKVLAQRQHLVDELAHLHGEMEPYRQQWEQVYGQLPDADRDIVAGLINEVEQLLAGIIDQDNHDQRQLKQSKDQVGKGLSQTAHAGVAMAAYKANHTYGIGQQSSGTPLTDRKG